jgi:hypothetical protein
MVDVLIAVAGRDAGTLRFARRLDGALHRRGLGVNLVRLEPDDPRPLAADLGGYTAVVLGSEVCDGRWLPAAPRFAAVHSRALSAVPLWVFSRERVTAPGEVLWRMELRGVAGATTPVRHAALVLGEPRHGLPGPGGRVVPARRAGAPHLGRRRRGDPGPRTGGGRLAGRDEGPGRARPSPLRARRPAP